MLNNSFVIPLALLLPLLLLLPNKLNTTKMQTMLVIHSGFVLLMIFTSQAHKEERFLYIIYPLLYLAAAASLTVILHFLLSCSDSPPVDSVASPHREHCVSP